MIFFRYIYDYYCCLAPFFLLFLLSLTQTFAQCIFFASHELIHVLFHWMRLIRYSPIALEIIVILLTVRETLKYIELSQITLDTFTHLMHTKCTKRNVILLICLVEMFKVRNKTQRTKICFMCIFTHVWEYNRYRKASNDDLSRISRNNGSKILDESLNLTAKLELWHYKKTHEMNMWSTYQLIKFVNYTLDIAIFTPKFR